MKSLIQAVAVAALIALPVASFAQTPAQAQLIQLEHAGYNPEAGKTNYPANIEAAQQRVDAKTTGGYGGVADGTSQSGFEHPQYDVGLKSIYIGH